MNSSVYQEVKRIVGEALDITVGPHRDAFLNAAFEKDPAIREEVQTLLAACEGAGEFLERKDVDTDPLIGERAGPYRIEQRIGEGGMGSVYRASREDGAFRMMAAVKVIRSGLDSAGIVKRFRNERQILARLSHPNIARLIDGGVIHDGRPYFVMEFVEGQRLNEAAEPLGLYQKLDLFRMLCKAVHYAHQNLVIHGDIKASNVIVTPDGIPKLLDFGVARLSEPDHHANAGLTMTFMPAAFTPDYASPEQVRGDALTTASDIYSLGVLLCELLTGRKPRKYTSPSPEAILRAIATQPPARPSELSGDTDLLGDLDNIVLKALEPDPANRYASAEQLEEDIRRFEAGLPVIARPDSFRYRAGKFVRRNRAIVLAVTLGIAALAGGLATTLWQARIAGIEKQRAERMFNDVRELANSFIFEIEQDIAKLPGSTNVRGKLVSRATQYLDRLAHESANDPQLQRELATAYYKLGDVLGRPDAANLGDTAGSLTSYRKALEMRERLAALNPQDEAMREVLAETYHRYSAVLKVKGDYRGALGFDRKALTIREELLRRKPDNRRRLHLGESYTAVGGSLSQLGLWNEVLDFRGKALAIYRQVDQEDKSEASARGLAVAANRMASILSRAGDKQGAIRQYREVLALRTALLLRNPNDSDARLNVAGTQTSLGTTLIQAGGHSQEAIAMIGQALATYESVAAGDPKDVRVHSLLSSACMRQAEAFVAAGDVPRAMPLLARSLQLRTRLSNDSPLNAGAKGQVAEVHASLGAAHEAAGRTRKALEHYLEAQRIAGEIAKMGRANAVISEIAEKSGKAVERLRETERR
jgi:non-specific serine/threonine protein kinase/serine/threonine-protein kinase